MSGARRRAGTCIGAVLAAAAAAQPAPYVDRLIEGAGPASAPPTNEPSYDDQGWARHFRLEGRLGTESFDPGRRVRGGLAAQALVETPNHGVIALDAAGQADPRTGTLSLRQRELPLPGGWWAGHDLGVLDRPTPSALRTSSRLFVPSTTLLGAAGQWDQPEQGWQLMAAHGQPGRLQGAPTLAFQREPGRRSMFALQAGARPADGGGAPRGWVGALLVERADGVAPAGDASRPERIDARSAQATLRLDEGTHRVQAHVLATDGSQGARRGAWLDAEWDEGPRRHGAGFYRLDEGLSWVDRPLPEGLQGLYYRGSWRTRQWSMDTSVDALQALGSRGADGLFATGAWRWRASRDHALGASFALRRFDGDASTVQGDWRWQGPWGGTGLRLEATRSQGSPAARRVSWDQDWSMPLGHALATSLGWVHESAQVEAGLTAQRRLSAAVSWAIPLGAHAITRGSLTADRGSLGTRTWGANLGATWRLAPRWSLEGLFVRSLGRQALAAPLDPLAPRPVETTSSSSRSFLLVLRHEFQAGSRSVPLGGRAQQGGGRVQGVVYFDSNRSGTQDASESGVPGVTLLLDNRYAVRTDAQGRFEFPFVAPGRHSLTLRGDTLPLPWNPVGEGTLQLEVQLRDLTELAVPVQRAP